MIRILLDENVPLASGDRLRQAGFDVAIVEPGASDRAILERARVEQRVLATFDRDFGYLAFRAGAPVPPAIVYFRTGPTSPEAPAEALIELSNTPSVDLIGRLTVIESGRVRQRPLPPG